MRYGQPNVTIRPIKGIPVLLTAHTGISELKFDRNSLAAILSKAGYRVAPTPPRRRVISRATAPGPREECWQKVEVEARKISVLCHFTPLQNVPGILGRGLLPRSLHSEIRPRPLLCDKERLDRHLDASSLSVSFPNYKLFTEYRCKRYTRRTWAVLLLSPEVLWRNPCSYYYTNAASGDFGHSNPESYQTRDAFNGLFASPVKTGPRSKNLDLCHPTDPQAEVLVFGAIDPRLIASVHVENKAEADQLAHHRFSSPVCVSDRYFGPRPDYESWKKSPPIEYASEGAAGSGSQEEEVPF
jgi:hypothetical protein